MLQTQHAAHRFRDALQQHKECGDRKKRLQRSHRYACGAVDADLPPWSTRTPRPVAPGLGGIIGTGIDQRRHAREQKKDKQRKLDHRLDAHRPQPIDHVPTHVRVPGKGIGPRHHEQGPVHRIAYVKRPCGRISHHLADEHLVHVGKREHQDAPGEGLSHPRTQAVDDERKSIHCFVLKRRSGATLKSRGGAYAAAPNPVASVNYELFR